MYPFVKLVQLRAVHFNVYKVYFKICEKNKNGVGRERRGIHSLEIAACNGYRSIHYTIRFPLYMFKIFHNKNPKHVFVRRATTRGQEGTMWDEGPYGQRAAWGMDQKWPGEGSPLSPAYFLSNLVLHVAYSLSC